MSRSEPPPSPTAGSPPPRSRRSPDPRPLRRRLAIKVAALFRWLHIYLSMFGLAATLFFGATGLTLNHPDWFFAGASRQDSAEGRIDPAWLAPGSPGEGGAPAVAKLEVVEFLRKAHGVRGALADFRVEDEDCLVTFKGPGYAADAFIDRRTGRYDLTQTTRGVVAVLNDLHKGRDTGPAWSLAIDLSAVLLCLIAATGLALLFYLKLRRRPGVVVALIGAAVVLAVVLLGVP